MEAGGGDRAVTYVREAKCGSTPSRPPNNLPAGKRVGGQGGRSRFIHGITMNTQNNLKSVLSRDPEFKG